MGNRRKSVRLMTGARRRQQQHSRRLGTRGPNRARDLYFYKYKKICIQGNAVNAPE